MPVLLDRLHSMWTVPPNSNGKVERANQVLGNTLRSLCNTVGSDWGENLALAEFAMNTAKHSGIDMSPFNLVHLREASCVQNALSLRKDEPFRR